MTAPRIDLEKWQAAACERYGQSSAGWRFRCPSCNVATTVEEWRDADAEDAIAFSCIGRFRAEDARDALTGKGAGPCNYAGGGLFKLNPVIVVDPDGGEHAMFDFADRPLCEAMEAGR